MLISFALPSLTLIFFYLHFICKFEIEFVNCHFASLPINVSCQWRLYLNLVSCVNYSKSTHINLLHIIFPILNNKNDKSLNKQYTFPTCRRGDLQSKWLTFLSMSMINVSVNTGIWKIHSAFQNYLVDKSISMAKNREISWAYFQCWKSWLRWSKALWGKNISCFCTRIFCKDVHSWNRNDQLFSVH